jgi:nitrite reductase/ring-hydroxylating ferredoxin subunit
VTKDLPDSWYPVCRSRDVRRGRPTCIEAFAGEWVIFRADNNRCAAVQRFCCHMGTDLSLATVVDEQLECPLHRWRFDGNGRCVRIPATDCIPAEATLEKLRCVERFGIVFVAVESDALFEFPSFSEDGDYFNSRPRVVQMLAPYETVSLNLFDVQHLSTVHERKLRVPAELFSDDSSHLGIRYSAFNPNERLGNKIASWMGMSANDLHVDCWGGNLLLISIEGGRPDFIMALMPGNAGTCTLYVATVENSSSRHIVSRVVRAMRLEIAAFLTRAFIEEDIQILSNANSFAGVLLPDIDAAAIRFWEYFDELPRISRRASP